MAAAVQTPPILEGPPAPDAPALPAAGEQRFILGQVPWPSYLKIGEGVGERRIRLT